MPQHHHGSNKKKKHHRKKSGLEQGKDFSEGSNEVAEGNGDQNNNTEPDADKPYEMKHSEIFGRYLVASRDLKAGEIVMEVPPLVIGPCADSDPICLGCYTDLNLIDCEYKCPGCGWRLCSAKCFGMKKPNGHSTWECTALREKRVADHVDFCEDEYILKTNYEAILSLRILLLRQHNKASFDKVWQMESHNDLRKNIPKLWNRNQKVIVEKIRNDWKFSNFTEDEIHTACGIIEVNSFEIGQNNVRARALFPMAYLMAHDCTPNTTHTDDTKTHDLTIRMTDNVEKGEMITVTYSYTLQGTIKRREHLHESKFFWCRCERCSDPTEFGTYSSALRCPKCPGGMILSIKPLEEDSDWKCGKCNYTVTAKSVQILLEKLYLELENIDVNSIDENEDFIKKYRNALHPNHYLFLSAKHSLCQLYGRVEGHLIHELSEADLFRKEEICRDLLEVVDKFEPGLTRLRGIIMYELHAPIMIQATRQFEDKTISGIELKKKLKEVIKLLTESERILAFEPIGSPEYEMRKAAQDAIKKIGSV